MSKNFYDKIAQKLGGYGYGVSPKYTSEYPKGNPEKIFKSPKDERTKALIDRYRSGGQ